MNRFTAVRFTIGRFNLMSMLAAGLALVATSTTANASGSEVQACSRTSQLMHAACYAETRDDLLTEKARCYNEEDRDERRECIIEARETFAEEREGCGEQYEAREEVCDAVGQAPYDPEFEPEMFETSLDNPLTPNPYYPLAVGNRAVYDGDEQIEIIVHDETKLIDDVTCFVIQDIVYEDGLLVEDTDDWFALAKADGSVWYCGEEVKDYEYFEGDMPSVAELIAIDGSFKVERDRARSGIVLPGIPVVGTVFRQEFDVGNAEDVGEIVSINYGYGNDAELDELVPEELAELLCNDDCLVVREYSPLEPGTSELKYYARGIGFFLGTNVADEESVQMVGCNFDPRCDDLPELDDD